MSDSRATTCLEHDTMNLQVRVNARSHWADEGVIHVVASYGSEEGLPRANDLQTGRLDVRP